MSRYAPRYEIEIRHSGLNKYRHITGRDKWVVEEKARAQSAIWDDMWERQQALESRRTAIQSAKQAKEARIAQAEQLTVEAQAELEGIRTLLLKTLSVDDSVQWDDLKSTVEFAESKPSQPAAISPPPQPNSDDYSPKFTLLDHIFPKAKRRKQAIADDDYQQGLKEWQRLKVQMEAQSAKLQSDWQSGSEKWAARRETFYRDRESEWAAVDDLRHQFEAGASEAIEEYIDLVLSRSEYPDWFNRQWTIEHRASDKIVVVEYNLPNIDEIPDITEYRYIAAKNEITKKHLSKTEKSSIYENAIYCITLRTIHEIFESCRSTPAVASVSFNGIVHFTDPSTGKAATNCICTIQCLRDEFEEINLTAVDPKACFKGLKGVSASKLDRMAPVAPLLRLERSDARFIEGVDIAGQLEPERNIAAMDWAEFEHLVRQVFEAEFSGPGTEVKVTRGSRDGGIDAIAFDPDPIRGGKIVIQAKRYTNTVEVSAVRDLYGTVVNEGASKGILVTTSQFGPDARKFAAGKPLTLIDGPNLLFLLRRQGILAKIDLAEAKLELAAERP